MDSLLAAELVREKLNELHESLRAFSGCFAEQGNWPATIARHEHEQLPTTADGAMARRLAAIAFKQLEFLNDQDERRVVRFVGALAVDRSILRKAEAINERKQDLVEAIGKYRKLTSRRERDSHQVRELLIRFGYARLNLLQAYRKIPILERTPDRIGFSWILGTNRVRVVHYEDAMRRISADVERSAADLRRIQREVFDTRRGGLRLVERVAPHVRANVSWYEGDERNAICIHAPMPILYPFSSQREAPEVVGHDRPEPDPLSVFPRQRRRDARLRQISGTIDVFRAG